MNGYEFVNTLNGPRIKFLDGSLHLPPIAGGDLTLEEVKSAFSENQNEIKSLLDKQNEEIKTLGTTSADTVKKLEDASKRYDEITGDLSSKFEVIQKQVDEIEAERKRLWVPDAPNDGKSLGTLLVESEAYKSYTGQGGRWAGNSSPVEAKLLTGASLGDTPRYLYPTQVVAGIIDSPTRSERVRDLLPVIPTSSGAIEYIVETGFTNAAAPVAEGENNKPESSIAFDVETTAVKTIAHWLPVTRQILSDAPALRAYIDNRLLRGLELAEDVQLLYGNGQGANIEGIMNRDDIQVYAIGDDTDNNGDPQNKLDAIRRAILKARVAEYPASGVVLHPNDWADIELLKGDDGHYLWVNVNSGGETRVWRVRVVETTGINPGEGLTGAFDLAAAIWDREEGNIRISDSHAGTFIQNIWTILAEERLALTVYRPEAFVKIDFEEGS